MKLSKYLFFTVLILSLTNITSCKRKDDSKSLPKIVSDDSSAVYEKLDAETRIKKMLPGENIKYFESGKFKDSLTTGFIAGVEYNKKDNWGIRFYYFDKKPDGSFVRSYSTSMLNGSFESSQVKKIKIASSDNELIYYNSLDYFMGSGGGEIYSYIIDPGTGNVYYAHFITVPRKPLSLFVSKEITNREIKEFFIRVFKKDYPDLKLVNKDYNLEDIF